jgi:hypothetical protein
MTSIDTNPQPSKIEEVDHDGARHFPPQPIEASPDPLKDMIAVVILVCMVVGAVKITHSTYNLYRRLRSN